MKLVHKHYDKDGSGEVTLIPEESEDMWHVYNLVTEGDTLKSTTIRKVTTESATGSTASNRVRTTLTIRVEAIDFDTQACMLRVKGRNIQENQYVKMGAYHTLDLELNRKFTLTKNMWDSIAIERVEMACDPTQNADVAAIIMHEGLAHICLVTSSMTLVRTKIDVNIPRKRKGMCAQHKAGLEKFFEMVYQGLLRHINFSIVKCVVVASPGFVKDQFHEYMIAKAIKTDNKTILENKSLFVLVHASTGFKHSLHEILADPKLTAKLSDTKAAKEIKCLGQFCSMLSNDPHKACYGVKQVERACEAQAIDTLLISDKLFRCNDVVQRKRFVSLVDTVREFGGDVKLFSSLHPSGEQLDAMTGIAAILRFPMEELDEISDEEDDNNN